ncbi:MAG: hypothetical protein V2A73_06730, partial [Pseudomonadota bacterium]
MSKLATEDRAAVLAAVLGSGELAPDDCLRFLAAPARTRCQAEARRILGLPREEKIRFLAREAATLLAELPENLQQIHESWLEHCLEGEGEQVRAAVTGRGTAIPAVRTWLRRLLLG